jgi:hypothetical protein
MQTGTKGSDKEIICMYVCGWIGLGHYVRILFGILYTPPQRKTIDRRGMRDE